MNLKNIGLIFIILIGMKNTFAGNIVEIKKDANTYKLIVNGKQTYILGVGCGESFGSQNENYLKLAKELGANAVRTWGITQGNKKYLDEAYRNGLFVCAGLWLNPVYENGKCSYLTDFNYQRKVKKEILDYIKKYKDHPAILFWNVGNEVFFFTKDEKERIGFAKFLNNLIKEIKKIDKNHPVIYTSSSTTGLNYIIKYVHELDIFGMNLYGGISMSIFMCKRQKLNKPIIITEFGPLGPWDRPKDINGVPIEQREYEKAVIYRNYFKEIKKYQDIVLGAFAFHLGETTQESLSWWNINVGNFKKESFWELFKLYTGKKIKNRAPRIISLKLSKQKNLNPGEWFEVKVKAIDPDKDKLNYKYLCSEAKEGILQYYVNKKINIEVRGTENNVKIKAPLQPGVYRIYVLVTDPYGNADIYNKSISVSEL